MYREFINMDLNEAWNGIWWVDDCDGYAKKFWEKNGYKLKILDGVVEKNGNIGFLVGDSITIADFMLLDFYYRVIKHPKYQQLGEEHFNKCKNLQDYFEKRINDPKF